MIVELFKLKNFKLIIKINHTLKGYSLWIFNK